MKKNFTSEFIGTTFLLAVVVGSGIMGDRLSGSNAAIALLANSIATGLGLYVLIMILSPVSGAEFNPLVTLINQKDKKAIAIHVTAQFAGAIFGVLVAHLMFGEALLTVSVRDRGGISQLVSEFVATFGLVMVVRGVEKQYAAFAVGAYIASAYWFTASTSFANPAVTVARSLTDTFSGIRPDDVSGFVIAQTAGALSAHKVMSWLKK